MATAASAAARSAGRAVSVIVMKASNDDPRPAEQVKRLGGHVGQSLPIVNGFGATVPESMVPALQASPGVISVTPNRTVKVKGQYGANGGVASAVYTDVTKASKAWDAGFDGTGVNVAVIDTGVDTTGDLAGQVIHAEDFSTEAGTADANRDTYGHGTFVAGMIAGTGKGSGGAVKGVAPGSKLVSIKIAGRNGNTDVLRLLAALEWVATNKDGYGIRVLNISLGATATQSYVIDPLDFAIERVWNSGIVVVAAAGNNGNAPGTITKPGDDPLVITVGASDDHTTVNRDDDTVAAFSGAGPTQDGVMKPDVVAPGTHVVSVRSPGSLIDQLYPQAQVSTPGQTSPGYFKGSGTSFSAGVVSGEAALIISRNWNLNPNQVKKRIRANSPALSTTTTVASALGVTVSTTTAVPQGQQGQGQVNAYQAVMSDDLTEAAVPRKVAQGTGSLQATRGAGALLNDDGTVMTDAQANALTGFDPVQYFGSQWAGSQWAGSQWAGSQWAGSQWTGSQWAGSQWAGSQWAGSQWAGSQWAGSQWAGSQWAGSQWAGSQWAGSQWAGSQWAGSQWASLSWAGSHWG
ncbi:MAG TPA: S8 family serine peptidase [Acidimicrobiales bacterium]|nr:S8 family serine peptidase [Acidimicrobiales bacterium]